MRTINRSTAPFFLALLILSNTLSAPFAATRSRPNKNHHWQLVTIHGLPAAIALPCSDCTPDLTLRCMHRRRGLMQLTLSAASVANGRAGATKQIRLSIEPNGTERRRATTIKTQHGYTPVVELAADDPFIERMAHGSLLSLNFYGQHSFVGLRNATTAIAKVRAICQPDTHPVPSRHCTWSIVIACSPQRSLAETTARNTPGAFVRTTKAGYCATLATNDLTLAKSHAKSLAAHVERSCLP